MFARFFVDRPVFASVISILILLGGFVTLSAMPVAQFPEISPPTVEIAASYPGASAERIAQSVAAPIEQQLSGTEGLLYFQSQSANDGSCRITVTFEIGTDLDMAAVDVQNRVKLAEPRLPQIVLQQGLTITKKSSNILLVAVLRSKDPRYDELFLNNYASINLVDALKRVPGVGDAMAYGAKDYSMRLWVNPDRMAQKGITVSDISAAVQEQNGLYAAGRIGQQPNPTPSPSTLPVITRGRLEEARDFEEIILRAEPDGSLLRLRDVGRAELGSQSYDLFGRLNGAASTLMLVYLQPGANALATAEGVEKALKELSAGFPRGVEYAVPYDTTEFIRVSIEKVIHTFLEAVILVVLVVFIFLQSLRATIIPLLAVPVSIIGTFILMQPLGFSVNTLSLFGLVLAIGIVVDDAIVVIENVERLMHEEHLDPREATIKAMGQVTGPVIASVLVLAAVFVPVGFLGGMTGQLYRQFAITIAVSVAISGVVALTLTPALCRLLLKAHSGPKLLPFRWFNAAFDAVTSVYAKVVRLSLRGWPLGVAAFGVICWGIHFLATHLPSGFIPDEDQGYFIVAVQLPDGASVERTDGVVRQVESFLATQEEVADIITLGGQNILANSAAQTNACAMFVTLKPWGERPGRKGHVQAVIGRTFAHFRTLREGVVLPFNPPSVPGLGQRAGFEYQLQSRTSSDPRELAKVMKDFVSKAQTHPEITSVSTTVSVGQPQLLAEVDREHAKSLGVPINEVFGTLQALLGSLYINDFDKFGRVYRVMLQAEPEFRQSPDDLSRVFVRNAQKQMVPLSTILDTTQQAGPVTVSRFNGFLSAQISGVPGPGFSTGDSIRRLKNLSADLPQGYGFEWSGQSYQEIKAGNAAPMVMAFGLIIVFLVLAAQYESFSLPVSVLLAVPLGLVGALGITWLMKMSMDVYFQIGLLTLIGLSAKTAILIVEFANQKRAEGLGILDAAVEAARLRFRPILMTSLAFILGVVPLMKATGAGAASQHSIGTGVFGGMVSATLLSFFLVPLYFLVVCSIFQRRSTPPAEAKATPPTTH
jgi:hydrophobe/amphiphile efflux-1 (HAE1) family protein